MSSTVPSSCSRHLFCRTASCLRPRESKMSLWRCKRKPLLFPRALRRKPSIPFLCTLSRRTWPQTTLPADEGTWHVNRSQYALCSAIAMLLLMPGETAAFIMRAPKSQSSVSQFSRNLTHVEESPGMRDLPPHAFVGATMPSQGPPAIVIETASQVWSWATAPSTNAASSTQRSIVIFQANWGYHFIPERNSC